MMKKIMVILGIVALVLVPALSLLPHVRADYWSSEDIIGDQSGWYPGYPVISFDGRRIA